MIEDENVTAIKAQKVLRNIGTPRNLLAIWQDSDGWHWDFSFDDVITTGGAIGMMEVAKYYIIANSREKE
jgi:hypothetical protein